MEGGKVQCYCNCCKKKTNHEIEKNLCVPDPDDDYRCNVYFQVVKCLGCDNHEFRWVFEDLENGHYVDPYGQYWEPDVSDEIYPKFPIELFPSREMSLLPEKIQDILKEVQKSLLANCRLLAGIGLRMLIEAMCNDLKIRGSDLQDKISNLAEERIISSDACSLLHKIRFLGNDVTHDIDTLSEESLKQALDIIVNVLKLHYVQPVISQRSLPKTLNYNDFKRNIVENAGNFAAGTENTVINFMKPDSPKAENQKRFIQLFLEDVKAGKIPEFTYVVKNPTPSLENQKIKRV